MLRFASRVGARPLALTLVALGSTLAACADRAPTAATPTAAAAASNAAAGNAGYHATLATLRRATARYHDLKAALDDDFVFLHGCEVREEGGPVGTVYVNFERLTDGRIDPSLPDALIYEPTADGRLRLVGVELAEPNTGQAAPRFLGHTFQEEDEFGVYGLHAWVWSENPNGMFAETNPRVSCGVE